MRAIARMLRTAGCARLSPMWGSHSADKVPSRERSDILSRPATANQSPTCQLTSPTMTWQTRQRIGQYIPRPLQNTCSWSMALVCRLLNQLVLSQPLKRPENAKSAPCHGVVDAAHCAVRYQVFLLRWTIMSMTQGHLHPTPAPASQRAVLRAWPVQAVRPARPRMR